MAGRSFLGKLLNQGPPVPYQSRAIRRFPLIGGTASNETYMRAMGQVGTIWSMITLLAQSTSRVEWRLYRKRTDNRVRYGREEGSDQRTEVRQHQALSVIHRPNDFWTKMLFFNQSQQYKDLTGESWWVVGYDGGVSFPTSLWPVRPDRMEPVPSEKTFLAGYVYTGPNGEQVPLGLKDVIFSRYPNPMDPYRGLGPVQSMLTDIDSAKYSAEWNRNFFLNGAEPGGVIQAPEKLTDEEFTEFTERWRETHRGVSRAHRVALLENMTWVPNSVSQKDMDFANLRDQSRDVMRETLGIHKVMLGVSDDVNRANAQTGEEVFESWKIVPRCDDWKDVLNNFYLPLFGSTGQNVEFDYVTPVPANREQDNQELTAKANAALLLVQAGYDLADVLEVVGLPAMKLAEVAEAAAPLAGGGDAEGSAASMTPIPGETEAQSAAAQDAYSADVMARLLRTVLLNGNGHKAGAAR